MSYVTCISVRQYNSKEEKEKVHGIAFSKLIEYVYGDFGTGHSRFMAKEWIREQFNPNIDNYIIDGTYQVGEFIDKNAGLIPENLIQQFYKEFGHDVLHGIPDEDTEGLRFVILTKQNLIELIRERCEIISDELEDKTKFVDTDYEDLSPKRQKAFVSDLLKTFRNESSNWKMPQNMYDWMEKEESAGLHVLLINPTGMKYPGSVKSLIIIIGIVLT